MAEQPLHYHRHNHTETFPVRPKLKPKSKTPSKSPESKYWASFKSYHIQNLNFSIPSISFSPTNTFAAPHSTSITLFSTSTFEPSFSLTKLSDVVSSCSFRSDGALLAASDLSGRVSVFDVKAKNDKLPIRTLWSHSRPVRFVKYPYLDKLHLVSGGDDGLVKYWDVAGERVVSDFVGHRDYVRCGDWSPVNEGIFASGSYDHVVMLWDVRAHDGKSVLEVNHGKPVEDLAFLPSGGMVATAGGNCVKIWDVIAGGRLLYSMESHNKTVTGICVGRLRLGKEGREDYRLLSVGLDGYLKVFDYGRMKVTHTMRFPAPLSSIGVAPDGGTRAIGTTNGSIYIGRRKVKEEKGLGVGGSAGIWSVAEPQRRVLRPTYFRYFQRGQGEKPREGDYTVMMRPKKVKLVEHDKLLKKFRHKEALVSALSVKNPENVVAVMEELVARRKLLKCVSNLDEGELGLLLGFLQRNSTLPRHASFLMGLAKKVIEMRAEDIGVSDALRAHVRNLRRSVNEEIMIQQSLLEIQGIISPLLRIAGRR